MERYTRSSILIIASICIQFLTDSQQLASLQMEKKVEEWEAEEAELKLAEFEAESTCPGHCILRLKFEIC